MKSNQGQQSPILQNSMISSKLETYKSLQITRGMTRFLALVINISSLQYSLNVKSINASLILKECIFRIALKSWKYILLNMLSLPKVANEIMVLVSSITLTSMASIFHEKIWNFIYKFPPKLSQITTCRKFPFAAEWDSSTCWSFQID